MVCLNCITDIVTVVRYDAIAYQITHLLRKL